VQGLYQATGLLAEPASSLRKWRCIQTVAWRLLSCTFDRGRGPLLDGIPSGISTASHAMVFTLSLRSFRHRPPWPAAVLGLVLAASCRSPRRLEVLQNQGPRLSGEETFPAPFPGYPKPTHQLGPPISRAQAAGRTPESSATLLDRPLRSARCSRRGPRLRPLSAPGTVGHLGVPLGALRVPTVRLPIFCRPGPRPLPLGEAERGARIKEALLSRPDEPGSPLRDPVATTSRFPIASIARPDRAPASRDTAPGWRRPGLCPSHPGPSHHRRRWNCAAWTSNCWNWPSIGETLAPAALPAPGRPVGDPGAHRQGPFPLTSLVRIRDPSQHHPLKRLYASGGLFNDQAKPRRFRRISFHPLIVLICLSRFRVRLGGRPHATAQVLALQRQRVYSGDVGGESARS